MEVTLTRSGETGNQVLSAMIRRLSLLSYYYFVDPTRSKEMMNRSDGIQLTNGLRYYRSRFWPVLPKSVLSATGREGD
jgi:hypothetical protein